MENGYVVGIDLGTSNCALALAGPESLDILEIPQVSGEGRVGEELTFASALYFPHEGQFSPGSLRLPWSGGEERMIAGVFAREMGALVPDRLITSAKSWLCQRGSDPRKAVLPWGSQSVERKLSAVEASRHLLNHLRHASAEACRALDRECEPASSHVVLTVPASFDEAARTMTARAAAEAGWGEDVVLLEEPQAAFYSWVADTGARWRTKVSAGELILVCDVGGGTTDFSLIAVTERDGNLELERISVGRHVLLGGDNMDLALAFALRAQLEQEGKSLADRQFPGLVHSSRKAKESLFENAELDEVPVSVAARGTGLFEGTIATRLNRHLLETVIIDGFFPLTGITDLPREQARVGLREFGLAYEADPVVSKHLAAFLSRSRESVASNKELGALVTAKDKDRLDRSYLHPDVVLFNGGVFRAEPLRRRMMELLQSWDSQLPIREIAGSSLELAVARGAAIYGRNKATGKGVRIRAGVSRSYYIGLEPSMPAIPGYRPPVKAVCVAEQGMEEGEERTLEDKEFALATGTTAFFRFFSSAQRAGDSVGTIVSNAEEALEETTSLEMEVADIEEVGEQAIIPVKLHTQLTELGMLRLWMQHTVSRQRWELTFSVRTE